VSTLNEDAKAALRGAGVSQAAWARANYSSDGRWHGDSCGCPDDRCMDGYHHDAGEECGCLRTLLDEYLSGEGFFASQGEQPRAAGGSGG
jgi:hypothetical protein